MLKKLGALFKRLLPSPAHGHLPAHTAVQEEAKAAQGRELIKAARQHWQLGNWDALVQLDEDTIRQHPEREKLALLAAAGHLQTGGYVVAERFIRLAREWGASKTLISQVLIAGVHNNLGRAAALAGRRQDVLHHFEEAVSIAVPGANRIAHVQGRASEQFKQLEITPPVDWKNAFFGVVVDQEPQRPLVTRAPTAINPAQASSESTK